MGRAAAERAAAHVTTPPHGHVPASHLSRCSRLHALAWPYIGCASRLQVIHQWPDCVWVLNSTCEEGCNGAVSVSRQSGGPVALDRLHGEHPATPGRVMLGCARLSGFQAVCMHDGGRAARGALLIASSSNPRIPGRAAGAVPDPSTRKVAVESQLAGARQSTIWP